MLLSASDGGRIPEPIYPPCICERVRLCVIITLLNPTDDAGVQSSALESRSGGKTCGQVKCSREEEQEEGEVYLPAKKGSISEDNETEHQRAPRRTGGSPDGVTTIVAAVNERQKGAIAAFPLWEDDFAASAEFAGASLVALEYSVGREMPGQSHRNFTGSPLGRMLWPGTAGKNREQPAKIAPK